MSAMDPQAQLYTRQQIAELTGIDGSSLNYWSREGLLVPTSGGTGKGNRRRFDFVQVNIAAVLGQLRRFAVNISALRGLADMLQTAASLGSGRELHPSNYLQAARLATALDRHRRGEEVLVRARPVDEEKPADLFGDAYARWLTETRRAQSDADVIADLISPNDDYDTRERLVAAAERMGPGREIPAQLYADLVYDVLAPGYSDSCSWLLALDEDETWRVAFGHDGRFFDGIDSEGPEDFGSGLFIPVSGVIRNIWSLKSAEQRRVERDRQRVQEALAAAGITATVTALPDTDAGFEIDAPGVDHRAIDAALGNTRFALSAKA